MSSVLRTALAATSLGAAAAFGFAGAATAAPVASDEMSRPDVPGGDFAGMGAATDAVLDVPKTLQLNPMNGGGLNPLSNTVGAETGGAPVDSGMVTGDVADGFTVEEVLSRL